MSSRSFKVLLILILIVFCMAVKSYAHCGKTHSKSEMFSLQKDSKAIQTKIVKPVLNILLARLTRFFKSAVLPRG